MGTKLSGSVSVCGGGVNGEAGFGACLGGAGELEDITAEERGMSGDQLGTRGWGGKGGAGRRDFGVVRVRTGDGRRVRLPRRPDWPPRATGRGAETLGGVLGLFSSAGRGLVESSSPPAPAAAALHRQPRPPSPTGPSRS